MRRSTNRKICAAGGLILLVCLVVSLTPWYRGYVAADHEFLCAKYRVLVEIKYKEYMNSGVAAEEPEEELLAQAVSEFYNRTEYTVSCVDDEDNALRIDGLCPGGGRYTVYIDEYGAVHATCSEAGHDRAYTEYVD